MVRYMDNASGFSQWNSMQTAKKPSRKMGFFWWLILFLFAWWIIGPWINPQKNEIVQTNPVVFEKSGADVNSMSSEDLALRVQGLRISNIELKKHHTSAKDTTPVSLLKDDNNFIEVGYVSSNTQVPDINTKWNGGAENMTWNNKDRISFKRNISLNNYVITIADTINNKSNKEISVVPYARVIRGTLNKDDSANVKTGGVVYANSKLDYSSWNALNKKSFAYSTVSGSFGFAEQYWETMVSVDANDQTISLKKNSDLYMADTAAAPVKIAGGEEKVIHTYIFAGPRMSSVLSSADVNIPGIAKTMDYGWFWFFAQPMLWSINWLNAFVGNYGLAIILMTLILRLLMWPLTRKSYVSTMAMQKMQPEIQRIQKLYANDKARQQVELMKVYQSHKTSPMSGCLPMLIQIPIFFALYKALLISVPMRSAHFLWISDLSVYDPYFILPILMGLTMWLQQYLQSSKTSNNANDPMASTQRVLKWMPILFTAMFALMPAGLVLYWTVSNLFGILQMYIIKQTMK